jgi:mevalonate kinase
LSAYFGHQLEDEVVNALAYEVEKLHHGTPSGIDNTVVTYAKPVYFIRGKPIKAISVGRSFTIVIGDTGIASPTAVSVGDVREAWIKNPQVYEDYFEAVGSLVESARQMIEIGLLEPLGPLMDANHGLLRKIGVSCAELDHLVKAAREAGAWGAKLSGGGRGGNMIALASPETAPRIATALENAGAVRTIITQVK